jgi:hypothetical protein
VTVVTAAPFDNIELVGAASAAVTANASVVVERNTIRSMRTPFFIVHGKEEDDSSS